MFVNVLNILLKILLHEARITWKFLSTKTLIFITMSQEILSSCFVFITNAAMQSEEWEVIYSVPFIYQMWASPPLILRTPLSFVRVYLHRRRRIRESRVPKATQSESGRNRSWMKMTFCLLRPRGFTNGVNRREIVQPFREETTGRRCELWTCQHTEYEWQVMGAWWKHLSLIYSCIWQIFWTLCSSHCARWQDADMHVMPFLPRTGPEWRQHGFDTVWGSAVCISNGADCKTKYKPNEKIIYEVT